MNALRLLFCLLLVGCLAGPVPAQTDDAALIARLKAYRFGGDAAALDAVAQWVRESRADPGRRRQAAEALAAIAGSKAAFEARQFACRQLVLVASDEQMPALVGCLADDQIAHYALLVLARIPGKTVDEALLRELPRTHGGTRLEIAGILGDRRDVAVVPYLAARLADPDAAFADAAAAALGRIADRRAAHALQAAFASSSGARRATLGDALLDCGQRMWKAGDSTSALALYALLDRDHHDPVLRAAVLRGVVQARGEGAVPQLLKALDEDGSPRQSMAAALAREIPGRQATELLCAALPKLTAHGRSLLLDALSDRADPAAEPAVLALCRSSDGAVRASALRAVGAMGDATAVPVLLEAAATGSKEQRDEARSSLIRLRDRAVDAKLIETLDHAPPPICVEAINALGERHVVTAVPRLIQAAQSPQHEVSTAALRQLRDMAQPADLPTLVALLLATPPGARDAVIDTVTEVARRGADESARTGALLEKLSVASSAADRSDLLTVLAQVGGPKALQALRNSGEDPAPEVRTTALRLLAEWPTDEPMDDLWPTIRSTQDARERAIALRGYIRMIGLNDQRSPGQAMELYRGVYGEVRSPEEKRLMLSGIAKVRSLDALDTAAHFLADESVRAEAELAVVEIARSTAGAYRDRTRAALKPIAESSTNENARQSARDLLALIDKFGDYVTAWEVSPAYQQEGADYSRLFDIPFPPEEPEHEKDVPWRLMPAGGGPDQPWLLDLLAVWGGEQRVAYLRTYVLAEAGRDRDVILELGSDDGMKVWWNGQVVLARNVQRAVAPGQEKVKLTLKPMNTLLLKITQNVLGWGAVARFTNPDGSPATGLLYGVTEGK